MATWNDALPQVFFFTYQQSKTSIEQIVVVFEVGGIFCISTVYFIVELCEVRFLFEHQSACSERPGKNIAVLIENTEKSL